jgi:hypothetical protein
MIHEKQMNKLYIYEDTLWTPEYLNSKCHDNIQE